MYCENSTVQKNHERQCVQVRVCVREVDLGLWLIFFYIVRERERVCVCVSECEKERELDIVLASP